MVRRIIEIDQEKCNGCGACAAACHEGAIGMVNSKATLLRDDYCDGLGDCLPTCPTGAITFVEREAAAYDEEAVKANMAAKKASAGGCSGGCPGSQSHAIRSAPVQEAPVVHSEVRSRLMQWPIQLKLLPIQAPFYQGATLLVAAVCGRPKPAPGACTAKLTEILRLDDIREVTVVRMEVPCCGGIQRAVETALRASGKFIPWQVVTLSRDGRILD